MITPPELDWHGRDQLRVRLNAAAVINGEQFAQAGFGIGAAFTGPLAFAHSNIRPIFYLSDLYQSPVNCAIGRGPDGWPLMRA